MTDKPKPLADSYWQTILDWGKESLRRTNFKSKLIGAPDQRFLRVRAGVGTRDAATADL